MTNSGLKNLPSEIDSCVKDCLTCYSVCTATAMRQCLETGGEHVKPPHFRLMAACAELCRTAAHLMLTGSEHHKEICRLCAEICTDCAKDCERVGEMGVCVETCRHCADSCRKMSA